MNLIHYINDYRCNFRFHHKLFFAPLRLCAIIKIPFMKIEELNSAQRRGGAKEKGFMTVIFLPLLVSCDGYAFAGFINTSVPFYMPFGTSFHLLILLNFFLEVSFTPIVVPALYWFMKRHSSIPY